MEPELATAVVVGIAIVGFIVWMFALQMMLAPAGSAMPLPRRRELAVGTENPAGTITGSAEVPGNPDELSAKLAERLARDGLGFLGPIKITGADRKEVSFEAIGNTPGGSGPPPANLRRGVVRFSGAGNKTRIEYRVEAGSGRVLLALGWLFIALGLAALVIGLCVEFAFVIPSPQAAIRAQAVQMIQAIHFIWPPFLFAHAFTAAGQADPESVRGARQQPAVRLRPAAMWPMPVILMSAGGREIRDHARKCVVQTGRKSSTLGR